MLIGIRSTNVRPEHIARVISDSKEARVVRYSVGPAGDLIRSGFSDDDRCKSIAFSDGDLPRPVDLQPCLRKIEDDLERLGNAVVSSSTEVLTKALFPCVIRQASENRKQQGEEP